ncbi:cytochrome b/b6 domain-containing protein [Saccharospirillum mangrovi]|uniref:cytochrome b/b6 domain-containing protein n=1 Tax=Saccharospirillum mangrovi TaxID=2161747 RepID=UPI000D3830DA|nr:cytochrome b/b6 domain-containing protein [Saccharospirillum mangrovi]
MNAEVKVWDLPVRLVHWGLVLCLIVLFVSVNIGQMQVHFYAGYALSALLVFRLLWALVGTTYARWSSWNLSPRAVFRHLAELAHGKADAALGHNPAGAAMAVLLLLVLTIQAVSGLFFSDDAFWFGPFNMDAPLWAIDLAAWFHPRLPALILLLVSAHILAVLYHRIRFKEPLVEAMVHGRKPAMGNSPARSEVNRYWLLFSLAAAVIWLGWLFTWPI